MLTSVCTDTLSHPHYPSLCTITLASPRKRGGGTADIIFSLAVQYSDSPAFTILKLFRAVTVGIEIDRSTNLKISKQSQSLRPSPHTNPFKTALSLAFRNTNICMHLYAFTSALSHSLFVGERACSSRCTNPCCFH